MSEQSKPHTWSSNNPRALVPTWADMKVGETKDWHVDKRRTRRLTDLLRRGREEEEEEKKERLEFSKENIRTPTKKSFLMRLPANLKTARGKRALRLSHPTFSRFCPFSPAAHETHNLQQNIRSTHYDWKCRQRARSVGLWLKNCTFKKAESVCSSASGAGDASQTDCGFFS